MTITSKKNTKYLVAFASTLTRYYDYALFGLSASMLAKFFLPPEDQAQQLQFFFLIYAFCGVVRPLGSIIFGRIGDFYGRVKSIKIAKAMSIISTLGIAFLPGYNEIGIISALCLVILRMVFLLSISGEVDATRIYITESVSKKYRYLGSALVTISAQSGVLIATLAYGLANTMRISDSVWRLCFLGGGIAGLFMLLFRSYLQESQLFRQQHKTSKQRNPAFTKENKAMLALAIITSGSIGGIYQFLIIFFGNFMQIIDDKASFSASWVVFCYMLGAILAGIAGMRVNQLKQIYISGSAILLLIVAAFLLPVNYQAIICLIALLAAFILVPVPVLLQSMFKIQARMRLYSLAHGIGSMGISSTTPFFCMIMWQKTGNIASVFIVLTMQVIAVLIICRYIFNNNIYLASGPKLERK